jgi:CARDB
LAVSETVQNVGPVGALASQVKFSLVSTVGATNPVSLSGSQDVPALGPSAIFNGSGTVTVEPQTLPGTYRLQACADYKKAVLESDENNCALSTGAVQVLAVPDLVVTLVTLPLAPAKVAPSGTIALTAFVKNQGLANAGASKLQFALVLTPGAAPIKRIPVVPVAAVASGSPAQPTTATVTISPKTPLGVYFVQACVDWFNEVPESSDENNCGTSGATLEVK